MSTSCTPTVAAVARIASLASDVIVDVSSVFSPYWTARRTSCLSRPSIISHPESADMGTVLQSIPSTSLVAYTANSSATLSHLLAYALEISSRPIVIHIAAINDLSDAVILRGAVSFFLHSSTVQQAHDNALIASRLAYTERKAVVHVFHIGTSDQEVEEASEDQVELLLSTKSPLNKHTPLTSAGTDEAGGAYETAASHTLALLRRPVLPFTVRGEGYAHTTIITFGSCSIPLDQPGITWISLSLISPFPASALLRAIPPSSSERILVLEQVHRNPMKYRPIFLDVCSALQQSGAGYSSVASVCLGDTSQCTPDDVNSLISGRANPTPPFHLQLGVPPSLTAESKVPSVPESEALYTNLLFQLFAERTQIVNAPDLVATHGEVATTPEFALGRIRGELRAREELIFAVEALLQVADCPQHLHALLSRWLLIKDDNGAENHSLIEQILAGLTGGGFQHPRVDQVLELRNHLSANSRWIIGSDTWSYDLGASGLHHIISSGLNVNLLILDTVPYSKRHEGAARRKLDVGLYAMNHGNVFVASVAIFSSYSQVLQALVEADRYSGPSIILAHIPYTSSQTTALEMLKETKNAVDSGFWPLYRWDPSKEAQGKDPFSLDSDLVKKELQAFLDRQNHLSQLVRTEPELAVELVSNLGDKVKATRRAKAREAYANLLSGIDAIPLLILYASDGGNAERKAKRLAGRAISRGLPTTIMTMDEYGFVTLSQEERHTVLITSTAGQGEPPQNGRMFFKALSAALLTGEHIFDKLKYSVFGMGDSHYWPRAEDFIYHNRPAKELDRKLEQLGAERFAALGLGDDQAADGTETGYKLWEPLLWKALGVDGFDMQEAEPEPITAEHIKAASRFLRGTIAEGFADSTTGRIADSDTPLTKMHGIYQQDDRDVRDERQAAGAELAYIFMIRLRLPAGLVTPEQWLAIDEISDEYGAGHFKVTTRQTFQFHGVLKRHVKPIIQKINRALIRTVGTCGDVCQNIVMSSIPSLSKLYEEAYAFAKTLSDRFAPRTTAYHEIWLDQKLIAADAVQAQVQEPLFGAFYMPRKFKIAIAFPPTNDVDVYGNDIGLIAITRENGTLAGFNVLVGGGMGTTSGNKNTYPRMGTMLGFITIDQGIAVCEQILIFQRDNGNRKDRKNARLKYTLDRVGVDFFKSIIEETSGVTFQQPRPFSFDRNTDHFGWQTGEDGLHHFTTFVENGRVQDEPGREFKTAFREIARVHKGRFRLTSNQHVIITEVSDEALPEIKRLLGKYKLDNLNYSGLRLSGAACVAFPTCGLAMAESERYLPVLMDKVEVILEENGLRNDSIVMRMSGCPNGCSRPYLGEVAFVGKAPGTYMMLLGGGYYGHRLNKIYRESVTEPEILAILKPMIKRYAVERFDGERFGDFVVRAGYIAPYEVGKSWYDRMGGEGIHRVAAVQPSAA